MATHPTRVLPTVLLDSLKSFLYFPIWWYSTGLINYVKGLVSSVQSYNAILGFSVWVRNIFTPLFGQRDFASRMISFVLRLANIIIRGFGLLIIIAIHFLFLTAWIILPPLLLFLIFT